tara:strand:- start:795 stop:1775 length:981 start_codon:yes stop_codon:yes gene_type:complete
MCRQGQKIRKFNLDKLNTDFFPKDIYNWCIDNYKYFYDINVNIDNKLSIAIKSISLSVDAEILEFIKIINFFQLFFNKNYKIHIIYLPTSFKKIWNKLDKLSPININSGVTISNHNTKQSTIIIFRKEESFKVLIHELLHVYIFKCPKKLYNPLIEESIIETWATILNCHRLLCNIQKTNFYIPNKVTGSVDTNPTNYDLTIYNEIFKSEVFKNEQEFSTKQTYKLLTSNAELHYNSPTFFYYIIKSAMICNPHKFLQYYFLTEIIDKCILCPITDFINKDFRNKLLNITEINNSKRMSMRMSKYGDCLTLRKLQKKKKFKLNFLN